MTWDDLAEDGSRSRNPTWRSHMTPRIAVPDFVSPSYFPIIAAVHLRYLEELGLDATVELAYPVTDAFDGLRDGVFDYVAGSAHAPLYAFGGWDGWCLLAALSQHMYWFLVARADLPVERGDLAALRGLSIGAAPGPVDGLRVMLKAAGVDPNSDVDIKPVPGSGPNVSFGVTAARALQRGEIDAFWANGMAKQVAVAGGYGQVVVDARRGDGPTGARDYTFAALATTQNRLDDDPDEVAAVIRALRATQRALRADSSKATEAVAGMFPDVELRLIADLVAADAAFYEPSISDEALRGLTRFSRELHLLPENDRSAPFIPRELLQESR